MIMCALSLLISLLLPFLCQDTLDYRVLLVDSALVDDLLHATLQLGLPAGREQLHLLKPWLNRGVVFVAQGDGGRVTAWRLAVRSRSGSAAASMNAASMNAASMNAASMNAASMNAASMNAASMNAASNECSNECCLK
jgi:hypothetical protein